MKVSKCTALTPTGRSFSSQYGNFNVWSVSFENGDSGEVNTKEGFNPKFVVGQEGTYEITPAANPQHAPKIKYINPEFAGEQQSSPGVQAQPIKAKSNETNKMIAKQVALKCAVKFAATDSNSTTDSILTQCDSFYQWLIKPDAPQAQPQANGATPQASPQPSQPVQDQMNFEQPPQWVDQA